MSIMKPNGFIPTFIYGMKNLLLEIRGLLCTNKQTLLNKTHKKQNQKNTEYKKQDIIDYQQEIEYRQTYQQKVIEYIYNVVQKYFSALNTKIEQQYYIDDYNNVKTDYLFDFELEYFIHNCLIQHIQQIYCDYYPEFCFDGCFDNITNMDDLECDGVLLTIPMVELEQNQQTKDVFFKLKTRKEPILIQKNNKSFIKDDPLLIIFNNKDDLLFEDQYSCIKDYRQMPQHHKLNGYKKHPELILVVLACLICLRAQNVQNKQIKKQIKPLEYEKQITLKLKELGFNAKTTKASGDQGADVLANKNGVSFAIQCKMYSNPVGNKAVQEVNTARDFYKCDFAVVVSNASFTNSARLAAKAANVILLNDSDLEKLLEYT
ncbi:MAG: restriction endonuclease [Alphaproteobacteria bacterium]|nr:restriction endonuclease [Alphaproteobacteria bacterium]